MLYCPWTVPRVRREGRGAQETGCTGYISYTGRTIHLINSTLCRESTLIHKFCRQYFCIVSIDCETLIHHTLLSQVTVPKSATYKLGHKTRQQPARPATVAAESNHPMCIAARRFQGQPVGQQTHSTYTVEHSTLGTN